MIKDLPKRLSKQAAVIEAEGHLTAARLMNEAAHELTVMLDALKTAEKADQKAINCEDHEPDAAPESCEKCFPLADDARPSVGLRSAFPPPSQPAKETPEP